MTSRFRLACLVGFTLGLGLSGCGDAFQAAPVAYKANPRQADLKDKLRLQATIRDALANLYGPAPNDLKVPEAAELPEGGRRLGNYTKVGDELEPIVLLSTDTNKAEPISGGFGLYRRYCLHCHGIDGGGDGPTAAFLFPRPRDYRPGKFKFTSVAPSNPKPTREDLRRTIRYGLHGTSMPAFEALMTGFEIEQVIDYVVFLSIRGETELALIDEAKIADKDDPSMLSEDTVQELASDVMAKWKSTEDLVVAPKARRVAPSRESILRGRDIFLGLEFPGPNNARNKAACTDCHGVNARGNGPSFVERKLFDKIVFEKGFYGGEPITDEVLDKAIAERFREVQDEQAAASLGAGERGEHHPASFDSDAFREFKQRMKTAWNPGSLDDWGNPLRPANLTDGEFKGGRRPIDLYWRISKGINGAKMPAHSSLMSDEQIWDVVNFLLALPYDAGLLADAEQVRARSGVGGAPATSASGPAPTPGDARVAAAPR